MKLSVLGRRVITVVIGVTAMLSTACGQTTGSTTAGTSKPTTVPVSTAPASTRPRSPATGPATNPKGSSGNPSGEVPEASGRNVNSAPTVGKPTAVEIPSIGVRSDLLRLGLAADGTAQVPSDPQRAGWFSAGPRPGDQGPAVILGHIDSRTGPAVFHRLGELLPGATVTVRTTSGRAVIFRVDRVEQVPKSAFPTARVYGPAQGRQLRLITCGGSFDRSVGHYRDNVIVFLRAPKHGAART